ncbi:MAG: hypothetical protein RIT32_595 [Actinomycetota bacterium]
MINRLFLKSMLISLLLAVIPNIPATSAPVSDCRISTAPWQTVSLGFPMAAERLTGKAAPKLLVLPYRLSDRPDYNFGEEAKKDYLAAAEQIARFSAGKSKPTFVFSDVINIPEKVSDMVILRQNQQQQWQKDEAKSTWGFIRRLIALSDPKIDFTGIDGVIMHGSSTSNDSWIAEAMMFSKNPIDPWFRTIQTAEGEILNAVLLDKRTTVDTITHEIMHLYGLTDLYGSQNGPGTHSLMASNADALLSYEKWVLGWIPDSQVQCIIESSEIDPNKTSTRIVIPATPAEQIVVIKKEKSGTAMVIDLQTSGAFRMLTFYSLDNELRPPIALHTTTLNRPSEGISVSNFSGVGAQLISPQYHLLVSNSTATELTLDLIPKAQLSNAAALISAAETNRTRIQSELAAAKPTTQPAVTKKKTITCVKGKTIRKVTAKKPKCPAGFKKR